jgi:hypothetical protein
LELVTDQDPPVTPGVDGMAVLEGDWLHDDAVKADEIMIDTKEVGVKAHQDDEVTGFH